MTTIWGEKGYLELVERVIKTGVRREDRTGTGTLSTFSEMLKFNLDGEFPLLTTKFVPFRVIKEELFWFLSGSDNIDYLKEKNVKIWDANTSRSFLDNRGLTHYKEGTLGPGYPWQWRKSGAPYPPSNQNIKQELTEDIETLMEMTVDTHLDACKGLLALHKKVASLPDPNQGVDQIAEMVRLIRTDPNSRRIYMTAWNVSDLDKMALVPCHVSVQFHVADGYLSATMYQRSADLGLGVPFNIASYALLVYMLGKICNLKPKTLTMMFGDAHVYSNHVTGLTQQIALEPKTPPTLVIKTEPSNIDDFKPDDFEIANYIHHPTIKLDMAV
uniref:thymidylate synthase n=1 Tax=Clandestinovirus TaxID=2831644 RepID=A0A8F8KLV7_9VIRU|nr:thymidylate synthase [Clandestinovirus]